MSKLFLFIICIIGVKISAQVSFIGFSEPECSPSISYTYTYSNFTGSNHGSGFNIFRNGVQVYSYSNSFGGYGITKLVFANDSVGYMVHGNSWGGLNISRTSDYGYSWVLKNSCGPNFLGLYVVNANYAYFVTSVPNPWVQVSRVSDIAPISNFIFDTSLNSDIYRMDTILNSSICGIDSLNIIFRYNSDTITYHINKYIPLITGPVKVNHCAVNSLSLNVPFDIGTIFNAGNVFTVQLSDSSGSFANPINIGSLAVTYADTINASIPLGLSAGNLYKIRVVSSDPVYTGTENGNITIYNSPPLLTFPGTNSVCIGSSTNLVVSGATTYTWSTGAQSSSIYITPTLTTNTTYTVVGANACGVSTDSINLIIDNTCQNIWPGDVNSDGIANNLDVLELGLHYTQSGTPRTIVSNNWQSYSANNWSGTITNGENLNHSDCNGDGIINDDDTLAIYNNYSLTHIFKTVQTSTISLQLTMIPDQDSVKKGTWGSVSIYLGDSINQISNINGLAYTLSYYGFESLTSSDSTYIEYIPSFLNASNQNLNFRKRVSPTSGSGVGNIYSATTHTNNLNVNGYGKIAIWHFKINPNLNINETLNFSLNDAYMSNSSGITTRLTSGMYSINAIGSLVGFEEYFSSSSFCFIPNPTNGLLTITSRDEIQKIELTNIAGQVLFSEKIKDKAYQLQLQQFSEGIYFVKATYSNGFMVTNKVILNH